MKLVTIICAAILGAAASMAMDVSHSADNQLQGNCTIDQHPCVQDLIGVSYLKYVKSAYLRQSGRTYRFVHIPKSSLDKSNILFLHGFPESSFDWRHQIEYFRAKGYGVIAPDLLGYGGTDKPDDVGAYRIKPMVEELVQLLDCLNIDKVHAVGHDFGSPLLSRFANFHPSRLLSASFLDVGYDAPPIPLNETGIRYLNNLTLHNLGFEGFGYWYFFNRDDAGYIMNAHLDSMWSIIYTATPNIWKTDFGPTGTLERFLRGNKMAPWGGWVTKRERAIHNKIFDPANKGYIAPLNWYKATYRDLNQADESTVLPSSVHLKMPVLAVGAKYDPIGTAESLKASTEPYAENFSFELIDAGHFMMIEKPNELNRVIERFVEKV